ncbi:hypothetical protein ONZ51_g12718 [Trametes cubensis]|uniref:Uncharacterized protein n=1 Tax=Trametes cubensis TaxID=1111947 RepID=A0AAD7TFI6_9APHY|nr:hypothetical protein ONZ51_g12718 [Trametes cubensis]
MDTLKRIFSKGKASKPGPRIKLYCKYPGCGRPFYPEHKIDCFCSPECLQDYNYTPPSHWFANIPSLDTAQRRWWSHKRNGSMPIPVKRAASIAILNPTPRRSIHHRRKHSDRPVGSPAAHGFVSPSNQYTAGHAARSGARLPDYTTKPLPQLPVNDNGRPPARGYGDPHHDANIRSPGRHTHRHEQDRHRTGGPRSRHEQRATNHARSPSASSIVRKPVPAMDPTPAAPAPASADVNPFADLQGPPMLPPVQRLSVLSDLSADVQPGEAM